LVIKFFRTIVRFLLIILLSSVLLIGVLQNYHVQSLLANVTSTIFTQKLGVKVWIDRVQITSYFNVLLKNVNIYDHKDEPMITAKEIEIDMNIFEPFLNEIPINFLIIDSAFVRLKQYEGDQSLNISRLISNISQNTDTVIDLPNSNVFQLSLDYVSIKNTRFVLQIPSANDESVKGMNYQDLDVKNININAEDIHIYNDSINGNILRFSAHEKCGFNLENIKTIANVGPHHLILTDLSLTTAKSLASLNLDFHYPSWSAYLNYIDDVFMNINISSSKINMEDIAFFAPALQGMDNLIKISGHVKGPVTNLIGEGLKLQYAQSTLFRGDVKMKGLPDIYKTFLDVDVNAFTTTLDDVKAFELSEGKTMKEYPGILEELGLIRVSGTFTGFYDDFKTNSELLSDIGILNTDAQFTNDANDGLIHYKGNIEAHNLDLGLITNMESEFGNVDFDIELEGKGLSLETVDSRIVGQITNMNFGGNRLNSIYVDAFVKEREFLGLLDIEDDLISSSFIGKINFDSINPEFNFELNLHDVKLGKLGLLEVDSSASLSSKISVNFKGSRIDSIIGGVLIDKTRLAYKGQEYKIDSLYLKALKLPDVEDGRQFIVSSDFLNGVVKGTYRLIHIPQIIEDFAQKYINRVEFVSSSFNNLQGENVEFNFKISNTNDITSLFIPSLVITDSVIINGGWNTFDSTVLLDVFSNRFIWDDVKFKNASISLQGKEVLSTSINVNEIIFRDDLRIDTLWFGIDSLNIDMNVQNNKLDFSVIWNNYHRYKKNLGEINGLLDLSENEKIILSFDSSDMVINDLDWRIKHGSSFIIETDNYSFDSIFVYSKNQDILVDGLISNEIDEDLNIRFNKFNISTFDLLLALYGINLDGFLSGDIKLVDLLNNPNFLANLNIKDFVLNGEALGELQLNSTLNSDQSIFLNMALKKVGNKGSYKPLYLEGLYFPKRKTDQIDLDLSLHNISIRFLDPFLKSFVSNLEGKATGNIKINGTLLEPNIFGEVDLVRTQFRIKYLNTLYSITGKLNLNNESIGFNNITIYDTIGKSAILKGGLTHHYLKNFGVDLLVKPDGFIALNTRKGMNKQFYGTAVVTGDLQIKGPFDNIFLNIDAISNAGTDIKIPISTTLGVSDNNFIVFVKESDTAINEEDKNYTPELSSFSLNMDLAVTPDAKVEISLPEQMGKINAQGNGKLNMNLSRTGNFTMSGDYKVSKGLFFFQIRNLLNRRFNLNEGGVISWTGDPLNGILNMSANYQVKTSLSSLGLEQDSSYRSRIPVDCIIGLTGPIMNPDIKFNFSFPNATEEVKQYVYSKIDTTNASEMSQQMLSLLVLNSFSLNTSNSNIPTSISGSSLQIVANQLSNWLSQISKDVDIGINYRPGTDLTNEEVEVALSTQLFDERVTVDGNFGYQSVNDNPANTTSSIVGDINVEVKITKDGRLRLKAFNRTNTVNLMDNTAPYTQGVGIFYRKEFNLIKDIFKSKKRKEKDKKAELEQFGYNAIKNKDSVDIIDE